MRLLNVQRHYKGFYHRLQTSLLAGVAVAAVALPMEECQAQASANAYALIMTIGDYPAPIPKLKGVALDGGSASQIARQMGVPDSNIRVLKDQALTLDGMRSAFKKLEDSLDGNSQVFVYYSGHGGRQMVDEGLDSRCAEMLITADGRGYLDSEFEAQLKRITAKSQKTVVLLDACHSGGVTTRSVQANRPFAPKSYTPADAQACVQPSNVLTRGVGQPKPPGSGSGNFVYIAAAKDSEISLDQPGKGGVATQAWLGCLSDVSQDKDGSGALTAEEVRACAQTRINTTVSNVPDVLPHHVSLTGNTGVALTYVNKAAPPPAVSPAKPASTPAPAPAAAPQPPVAQPVVVSPSPIAALNDIYNNRDDRKLVTLSSANTRLKIGQDMVDLTLTSREGGYAYLLMVGSDGQTFDLLFPNQLDTDNKIEAGGTLRLPRSSWQFSLDGPPGKDWLLAIVSDAPKDFSQAGLRPAGPFSSVPAAAAKDIQLVSSSGRNPANGCNNPQTFRNIGVRQNCNATYGAALLMLEEVR